VTTCPKHLEVLGPMKHAARHWRRLLVLGLTAFSLAWATAAGAAETINAYSIWPENWARPMLQDAAPTDEAPSLTVYYLGVPDTTPEFASAREAQAYLLEVVGK
jgi:hypothetical protein